MPERESDPEPKKNAPWWVKVFVPLHIIAITSWALPNPPDQYLGPNPAAKLRIKSDTPRELISSSSEYLRTEFLIGNLNYVKNSPLRLYLLTTGFWQYWDMFAPNPANVDIYCDAEVFYADGTKRHYDYPRIYEMPIWEKFFKERWRKFFERAGSTDFRYLWPVFGQRIADMCDTSPGNPPIRVELHKHEMVISAPGEKPNTTYTDTLYYTYYVDPLQLKRDEGR